MTAEFDLIARHFSRPVPAGMLGAGDDCALMPVPPGRQLAASTDMLLCGRHFFPDVDPAALGHKALAVNLSDLAAMGAQPLGCLLGLALPRADDAWLAAFADGFYALAERHGCPLAGGDTTRGKELAISVTVFGAIDPDRALPRSAAQAGDDIWVSGELGAADLALRLMQGSLPADPARLALARVALEWPAPQLALGRELAGIAHAAIDISDGLMQDLGHILAASGCGAELRYASVPAHESLQGVPEPVRRQALLAGGDAYQLCFTAAPARRARIEQAGARAGARVTLIGTVQAEPGLRVRLPDGGLLPPMPGGFDHFRDAHGA
ncbi:thiamine-phosphate kinase [Orrella sp. JC864]|uniref:thiamine-phosphate kinase n=1 Tax=Orrella sp. JC864 TaxID=3120298 RepID=UPI00300B0C33